MNIFEMLGAIFVGISLGLTGGGGALLALPIMVYLGRVEPELARTYSLFIIAAASLVGTMRNIWKKNIDYKIAISFLIPAFVAIFIISTYVFPRIPAVIFSNDNILLTKANFIMLLFAIVMFIAAFSMIKSGLTSKENTSSMGKSQKNSLLKSVLVGLMVGTLTELIGAGGGFLIVPALVLFFGMDMHLAIGTSMFIVLLNTLSGIVFHIDTENIDWKYLEYFILLVIVGLLGGIYISRYINSEKLKIGFGIFVIVTGSLVVIEELFLT